MKKHEQPILIVSDDPVELEEVKLYLRSSYSRIYDVVDEELAIHFFEQKRVAVLLLVFRSLQRAEKFYLKLFHECEDIYEIPHQVIVLITRSELERAYELCRREIFHSFVIVRPLLSEYFLRLAMNQALEKRAAQLKIHQAREMLKRLALQFEHIRKEFDQLMTDNQTLHKTQRTAQRDLAESINYRLGVFRDSLMDAGMQDVITVHNAKALNKKFDHLQHTDIDGQLEFYHGKMNDALDGWTQNMESKLTILEQVSSEVIQRREEAKPEILIIDDDDIQRHLVITVLEQNDYEVRQAANGREGMSMLLAKTPDLVFLDIEMPDLDGIELLKKARRSKELKEVPIIMLTGHQEKEVVKRCLENGANDYLVKPVTIELLCDRMKHYFPHVKHACDGDA